MRPHFHVIALLVSSTFAAAPARAQTESLSTEAKLPITVQLTGRLQVQWSSTSIAPSDLPAPAPNPSTSFETRRARIAAIIHVGDWIEGVVEPEFALGNLHLRRAFVALAFDSAFVLRVGQFKHPFSLVYLTSSATYPMIERGLRIRGLATAMSGNPSTAPVPLRGDALLGEAYTLEDAQGYSGLDIGAALEGRRGDLAWFLGAFNGTGSDAADENDSKSVSARLTYDVDLGVPLTLGGAWSRRELNWPDVQFVQTRSGNAFEVDAELGGFQKPVWMLAQVTVGDNLASEERFVGAQAVLASFHSTGATRLEGFEPTARVSWGDPDRVRVNDAGMLVTPGLNLYFAGRNRLMLNWDIYLPESTMPLQHSARAQMNLYF